MDEPEMEVIARTIGELLEAPEDDSVKERARRSVRELMSRFPAYAG